MKLFKISLVAILAAFIFSACEKEYKEPTGMSFEGWWMLDKTFVYTDGVEVPTDTIYERNALSIITDSKDNDILEFYSEGTYDSSFFYTLRDNDVVCRKINDLQMSIQKWPNPDDPTEMLTDTIFKPMKPMTPVSDEVEEKYLATISFTEVNLVFKRFKQSPSSTDKPYQVSYFSRAKEK